MKQVIAVMALFASGTVYGAYQLFERAPVPVATAVIAEKPGKTMGGVAAVLLPKSLSNKQSYLLNMAYSMAKQEGIRNPEVLQAILLQETGAGTAKSYKVANPGPQAYYGPMQLKLAAARDVLSRNPKLYNKYEFHTHTDDEVKANLILNEKFNVEIAAKYVRILEKEYALSGTKLTNAYNRGPTGVQSVDDDFHYAREGAEKLAAFKRKRKL
ncbi:hypothetical protein [Acinetobacter sp.]|uniref:hypothetical protein n=1 Tax=Acinetobacter sp. TaxID=472 RepID=UPI00388F7D69